MNTERAVGALVGAVAGDALGAPFEFGPPRALTKRFPTPALLDPGEMTGGGAWSPAEWTDDTQMGLLVARSLLDRHGLDEEDLYARFVAWYRGQPKDVGIQTSEVLASGRSWRDAAAAHYTRTGKAAGNGSLMRTTPAAIFFARHGRQATVDAARRISDLTHGDPAAGDGCAIYHELLRVALDGADPLDALPDCLEVVPAERRTRWEQRLGADYEPSGDPIGNGAVWPTLATAVWALRTTSSFESALRAAVDVGNDTDTVACVTGGLAGAVYTIGAIPSRWTTYLHGTVIGPADSGIGLDDLQDLGRGLLAGRQVASATPPTEHVVEPVLIGGDDLLYGASFPGVVAAFDSGRLPGDALVVSLSRTFGRIDQHRPRRQIWMIDQNKPGTNVALGEALDDVVDTIAAVIEAGQRAVVHCHGGRSRTGLVLRAWLMARNPAMTVEQAGTEAANRWPHLDLWNRSFTDALTDWARRRRATPR